MQKRAVCWIAQFGLYLQRRKDTCEADLFTVAKLKKATLVLAKLCALSEFSVRQRDYTKISPLLRGKLPPEWRLSLRSVQKSTVKFCKCFLNPPTFAANDASSSRRPLKLEFGTKRLS